MTPNMTPNMNPNMPLPGGVQPPSSGAPVPPMPLPMDPSYMFPPQFPGQLPGMQFGAPFPMMPMQMGGVPPGGQQLPGS